MRLESRLASSLGRDDEEPNQDLAAELAELGDVDGIEEIASLFKYGSSAVQSDCIKVLYEIGYLNPRLIAPHARLFLDLLENKQTRLMWGAMTALATIASIEADTIAPYLDRIQIAMNRGSVIAVDQGVRVMAGLAASSVARGNEIFPLLLEHLDHCRSKEIPQHAESTLPAVNPGNRRAFLAILEKRLPELTPPQTKRVQRVIKAAGGSTKKR